MSDQKISELPAYTSLISSDVLPVVDTVNGVTRKVTKQNLAKGLKSSAFLVAASNASNTSGADYVCDGTADEVQINQAIAALPAGGGRVILSEGTFTLAAPIAISASNVALEGQGQATIITLGNAANCNVITISGNGVVSCKVQHLKIDGNYTQQSTGDGISVNTPWVSQDAQHLFKDLDIFNTKVNGISFAGDTRQYFVENVRTKTTQGSGFALGGSDQHVTNCIADTSLLHGFHITGANAHLLGCKAFYCANGSSNKYGFYVAVGRTFMTNCEAQDNYSDGIYLENGANGCTLVNCVGDSNGQTSGKGLKVLSNSNSIVGGAYFNRAGVGWTQDTGISFESDATKNITIAPVLYSNTNQYADSSTGINSYIAHNLDGQNRMALSGGGDTFDFNDYTEFFLTSSVPTLSMYNASDRTLTVNNTGGGKANLLVQNDIAFAGRIYGGLDTMTYAATISLDVTKAYVHQTTTVHATGNATINASTGGLSGQIMIVIIKNDATSGKTITFGTNFRPVGTVVGTTSKAAVVTFVSESNEWFEVSRSLVL